MTASNVLLGGIALLVVSQLFHQVVVKRLDGVASIALGIANLAFVLCVLAATLIIWSNL